MSCIGTIFAQITVEPRELGSYWHNNNISRAGMGTVISAISVLTVLLLVWAIFIRKPKDDRPRRYQYPAPPDREGSENQQRGSSGRRRKKRRRRGHRPRKPTLAETGGLPPLRNELPTDDPP